MTPARLVLEDGTILEGEAFGAQADAVFELVFNTSLTGYQEILSDPSYRGQGIVFTAVHIGNVGINPEDVESTVPQASALVVRALSPQVSSWRATASLPEWLSQNGVPGISGVDTRYLTRKLRDQGTLRAAISTCGTPTKSLLEMALAWPGLDGIDMVQEVTCDEAYYWRGDAADGWLETAPSKAFTGSHIVVYDFGAKRNILRHLQAHGAQVTVVPASTTADEVLAMKPDGVVLSNGPGDPGGLPYAVQASRALVDSGIPTLGICLGHQLLGLAVGGRTGRLKFGHHGGNHPVQDLSNGKVLVTSQNHNFCVLPDSLDPRRVRITHQSLNDGSVEGLALLDAPVFSVQFHPEASPGPHDAHNIFQTFFNMIHSRRGEA